MYRTASGSNQPQFNAIDPRVERNPNETVWDGHPRLDRRRSARARPAAGSSTSLSRGEISRGLRIPLLCRSLHAIAAEYHAVRITTPPRSLDTKLGAAVHAAREFSAATPERSVVLRSASPPPGDFEAHQPVSVVRHRRQPDDYAGPRMPPYATETAGCRRYARRDGVAFAHSGRICYEGTNYHIHAPSRYMPATGLGKQVSLDTGPAAG